MKWRTSCARDLIPAVSNPTDPVKKLTSSESSFGARKVCTQSESVSLQVPCDGDTTIFPQRLFRLQRPSMNHKATQHHEPFGVLSRSLKFPQSLGNPLPNCKMPKFCTGVESRFVLLFKDVRRCAETLIELYGHDAKDFKLACFSRVPRAIKSSQIPDTRTASQKITENLPRDHINW